MPIRPLPVSLYHSSQSALTLPMPLDAVDYEETWAQRMMYAADDDDDDMDDDDILDDFS
jgi:hypothetical protein